MKVKILKEADSKYWVDCRINSLYQFMLCYGIEIPRNYIFLLSEAFSFYYMHINYNKINIPFAAASENNLEDNFFHALEYNIIEERLDDSTEALNKMKFLIQANSPILMHTIEQMFVRHAEIMDDNLKVNIRMQSIPILIGIDDNSNNYMMYWVSSGQSNPPFMIRAKRDIDRLRNVNCLPYAPNYWCTYLNETPSIIENVFLFDKVQEAVANIVKKMIYGKVIDPLLIKNFNTTEAYIGLEAMERMCLDLKQMSNHIAEHPDDIGYMKKSYLSLLMANIGLFKGSHTSFRKEFGEALCQLGTDISVNELSMIGVKFIEISHYWKKLFLFINKLGKKESDKVVLFLLISQMFDCIYKLEYEQFSKLSLLL